MHGRERNRKSQRARERRREKKAEMEKNILLGITQSVLQGPGGQCWGLSGRRLGVRGG